uniref:Uncharacterized protein n=1 Tax=Phascolarctos cinereus TaxID=38626 RepID=A0A6P5LRY4_PHACI|nr:putative uncharacterized protein ENSP00000383309 [Phascolarctos cinereus]
MATEARSGEDTYPGVTQAISHRLEIRTPVQRLEARTCLAPRAAQRTRGPRMRRQYPRGSLSRPGRPRGGGVTGGSRPSRARSARALSRVRARRYPRTCKDSGARTARNNEQEWKKGGASGVTAPPAAPPPRPGDRGSRGWPQRRRRKQTKGARNSDPDPCPQLSSERQGLGIVRGWASRVGEQHRSRATHAVCAPRLPAPAGAAASPLPALPARGPAPCSPPAAAASLPHLQADRGVTGPGYLSNTAAPRGSSDNVPPAASGERGLASVFLFPAASPGSPLRGSSSQQRRHVIHPSQNTACRRRLANERPRREPRGMLGNVVATPSGSSLVVLGEATPLAGRRTAVSAAATGQLITAYICLLKGGTDKESHSRRTVWWRKQPPLPSGSRRLQPSLPALVLYGHAGQLVNRRFRTRVSVPFICP